MRKLLYLAPLLLAAAIFGALQIANSSEPDPPSAPSFAAAASPSPTPLDIEAEFKRLYELGLASVKRRSSSTLDEAFLVSGSTYRRSQRAIDELLRDEVIDKSDIEIVRTEVTFADEDMVRLRVTSLLRPCFVTESGRDVTEGAALIRRVTLWKMRFTREGWRIADGVAESADVKDERAARCGG